MAAKTRNLPRDFDPTHQTNFTNLLVSGCSFTYNNSEEFICTWPYYLRNHCGFEQVFDCSQSGAGNNHIFNSLVNEIETNPGITAENTLVIVMWSGFTRTDVIATQDVTKDWHHMSNYSFDDNYRTFSIFNSPIGKDHDKLCELYKKTVDSDAQIYESLLKIIAVKNYLENLKFNYVFTSFQDPLPELSRVNTPLVKDVWRSISSLSYLREFAEQRCELDESLHPTPNCYAAWTREVLIPELEARGYCTSLQ